MSQNLIIYPLFVMVVLSLVIGAHMLKLRYRAVLKEGLHSRYFLLNQGAKLPDDLIKATQHYDNLYETPVLFYVVLLLIFVLQLADYGHLILGVVLLKRRLNYA